MSVSSYEYIQWVHRSLNRLLNQQTKVTGETTAEYRWLVKRYQDQFCKPVSGKIDRRTQDSIIFANHSDGVYSDWLRQSLSAFFSGAAVGTSLDEIRKALKVFQGQKKIDQDGWAGPNTELGLYLVTGVPIPEITTAPLVTDRQRVERLCDRLLEEIAWGDTVIIGGHAALVIPRMVKKLRSFNKDYQFFSWHNAKDFQEGWDKAKAGDKPLEGSKNLARIEDVRKNNAMDILMNRMREEAPRGYPSDFTYRKFKEIIRYIYDEIDHGLWQTMAGASLGNLKTGGTYGALTEWTDTRIQSDHSILSAWPPGYEKFLPWEQLPQF